MNIILVLLILGALIGLLILAVKIYHSSRLKLWQKHLFAIPAIGGSMFMLLILILFLYVIYKSERAPFFSSYLSVRELSKSPEEARSYLQNIGIEIEFPEFEVDTHWFESQSGHRIERWKISFIEPLSDVFLARLDSLCRVDSARWRHYDKWIGHGMASDIIPCYEFSYLNPEQIELREAVTIIPVRGSAVLTHNNI